MSTRNLKLLLKYILIHIITKIFAYLIHTRVTFCEKFVLKNNLHFLVPIYIWNIQNKQIRIYIFIY